MIVYEKASNDSTLQFVFKYITYKNDGRKNL